MVGLPLSTFLHERTPMFESNCATVSPFCPARSPKPCLLCGRRGVVEVLYFPGKKSPAAPPPGRGRNVRYALCEPCNSRRRSLLETIEARIESDLRASGLI